MKRSSVLGLANGFFLACCILYIVSWSKLHMYRELPEIEASREKDGPLHPFLVPSVDIINASFRPGQGNSFPLTHGNTVEVGGIRVNHTERLPQQHQHPTKKVTLPGIAHIDSDEKGNVGLRVQRKEKKFWRYDEAGPKILNANTHYLSSIPKKHRLALEDAAQVHGGGDGRNDDYPAFLQRLESQNYLSDPNQIWPNKLHLYETNPSIVRLPEHYRTNPAWRQFFVDGHLPLYVSSYRITHHNNCYDPSTTIQLVGGTWKNKIPKTDYVGISLMDADLNILMDVAVDLKPIQVKAMKRKSFFMYNDFRLFNLGEQLYLTSMEFISPIHLSLSEALSASSAETNSSEIPQQFVEIPPAFQDPSPGNTTPQTRLRVWARRYSSCPVGSTDRKNPNKRGNQKNLLYFGADPGNGTAKVLFYPRFNPNDVRDVDLTAKCNQTIRAPHERGNFRVASPAQPVPAFATIEALWYPDHKQGDLFMNDRGSACCTRVPTQTLRPSRDSPPELLKVLEDPLNDELLVAMVHPKTIYPGKRLPDGVGPNIYLSRFIAFLPNEPYTIVAQSGMFCLGYPARGKDAAVAEHPLQFVTMNQLEFGNETLACPKIHFATGMVDAFPKDGTGNRAGNSVRDEETVIVSYGVSDCLSRFVEIPKSEIVRMLSADD